MRCDAMLCVGQLPCGASDLPAAMQCAKHHAVRASHAVVEVGVGGELVEDEEELVEGEVGVEGELLEGEVEP